MALVSIKPEDAQHAQKLILVFMVVIVAAAFVERYSGKSQQTATVVQIFIGAFVGAALLILISYVLPEFAVGLAATAMLTMLIAKGQPFWDAINAVLGKKPAAVPASPTSPLANHPVNQQQLRG